MKLSLSWIFDHLNADLHTIDIHKLVNHFNQTVAEIERWNAVHLDIDSQSPAQVIAITDTFVTVYSPYWRLECNLPTRADACIKSWYLITRQPNNKYAWTTAQIIGGEKEMLMPAISYEASFENDGWQKHLEQHDYILEIDNKSITHRPDLWGHRGCAREIAALLQVELKSLESFLTVVPILSDEHTSTNVSKTQPISLTIDAQDACKRFATLYLPSIESLPSSLWMASRLARIDSRAINFLVDATNYTMYDIGQPMHAFDVDTLEGKQITVRYAQTQEQLTVLDGQSLTLASDDVIIADGKQPIALAGIMGGSATGITNKTKTVLLEAAWFDPATIRHSAMRHKKRTDASARFEKNIDPNNNIIALQRCLQLIDQAGIHYQKADSIVSLGKAMEPGNITITHNFIQQCLGITIPSSLIIKILTHLEFIVKETKTLDNCTYDIIVPTFRATKDIKIPEDIVEEVGRFIGYNEIKPQLPSLPTQIKDIHIVNSARLIRSVCAHALHMQELYTYAFFDESFLRELAWQPDDAVMVQNPVSENWQRLVTSLIPNMLKAVQQNMQEHPSMNFFELARIWHQNGTMVDGVDEKKSLTGILYNHLGIDFYDAKASIEQLLQVLGITVTWHKTDQKTHPWFNPHQTAILMHQGKSLGIAGLADTRFIQRIGLTHAFLFELDADFLLNYRVGHYSYKALSKYPSVERDISILVPLIVTVDEIRTLIKQIDVRIEHIVLIDFFEKPEWENKKSLTLRIVIQDLEKTLTTGQVDEIINKIIQALQAMGAQIR